LKPVDIYLYDDIINNIEEGGMMSEGKGMAKMKEENKEVKLGQQHLKLYKNYVLMYIDRFGLHDWEVTFEFIEDDKKNEGVIGQVNWLYTQKKATFKLCKSYKKRRDRDIELQIRITALHEVLHLLLAELQTLAEDRTWDQLEYERATHSVINTLINTIFAHDFGITKVDISAPYYYTGTYTVNSDELRRIITGVNKTEEEVEDE